MLYPEKSMKEFSCVKQPRSGFTRFNAIMTSFKSLKPDYSSKNHVRKFLRALSLKWRAKVTTIEKDKDLATLPLDGLIGNLKKASDDSDSQGVSDEDIDEEEAKAFNLLARNFCKFFRKGNRFEQRNRFGNGGNQFSKGRGNSFGNKGGESLKQKRACYNCEIEGYFTSECRKPKENKAFVRGAWSDSEDDDEHQNDASCLMAIKSQEVVSKPSSSNNDLNIIDLKKENEELLRRNGLYTWKLRDNSKQRICLASVVDNSTLWHRRLGHADMRESR
nr:hypothetical protein [Tanacetum cinerariifolium]